MTEQEIIVKAKNALDALQIRYEKDEISVNYHENLDNLFNMLELDDEERKGKVLNLQYLSLLKISTLMTYIIIFQYMWIKKLTNYYMF